MSSKVRANHVQGLPVPEVSIFTIHVTPKQPSQLFSPHKKGPCLDSGGADNQALQSEALPSLEIVIYARLDDKQLYCSSLFLSRCFRKMFLSSPIIPKHCLCSLPWLQEDPFSLYRLLKLRWIILHVQMPGLVWDDACECVRSLLGSFPVGGLRSP